MTKIIVLLVQEKPPHVYKRQTSLHTQAVNTIHLTLSRTYQLRSADMSLTSHLIKKSSSNLLPSMKMHLIQWLLGKSALQ